MIVYSRRLVYLLATLWALFLYQYVAYTIPLEGAALTTLMRYYGLTALGLLFITLSPGLLRAYFPLFSWNPLFIYARRALGVSTFFFALLHGILGFFINLEGSLGTIFVLPGYYQWGLLLSTFALTIFSCMALTSFDAMVRLLGGARWKNLHRLVYIAAILTLIHVFLLGSHFTNQDGLIAVSIKWLAFVYLVLEIIATSQRLNKNPTPRAQFIIILLVLLGALGFYVVINIGGSGIFNIHKEHISHFFIPTAWAHTFRADGPIGVTTHIEPNDEPVAGEKANIFVEVHNAKNSQNTICDCEVLVNQNGKQIGEFVLGGTILHQDIIFPESGPATVTVQGALGSSFVTKFEYYISGTGGLAVSGEDDNSLQVYSPYITALALGLIAALVFYRK